MKQIDTKISIVLPAYNESDVISESVKRLLSEIRKFSDNYEIIIVNDGSTDDTKGQIIQLSELYPEIRLISYKNNKGKGYAIKKGLLNITGDLVVIMDADLDIHPRQIYGYIDKLIDAQKEDSKIAGVIGSKLDKRSKVYFPMKRKIMSYGYYIILKTLFKLDTKDTNTGLKVYDSDLIRKISPILKIRGYAYDIELLRLIYKRGYRVLSLPIRCKYTRVNNTDRIRLKHIFNTFSETLTIFLTT